MIMGETSIEWARYTFNPWRGCAKIAPECENCYAAQEAKRFPDNRGKWGPNGTRVVAAESMWKKPLQWNREAEAAGVRERVFCASLSDVFEDWRGPMVDVAGRRLWVHDCEPKPEPFRYVPMPKGGPDELLPSERRNYDDGMFRPLTIAAVRKRLFELIDRTPWLDWLLLTKRPENIRKVFVPHCLERVHGHVSQNEGDGYVIRRRDNVWFGTSAGTQATANKFVPELLKAGNLGAKTFVSAEPLLEAVDFRPWLLGDRYFMARCKACGWVSSSAEFGLESYDSDSDLVCPKCDAVSPSEVDARLDLIIAGGESGPGARPCSLNDLRSIVAQTAGTSTSCFIKQLGGQPYDGEPGYMIPLRGGVVDHVKHKKG